MAFLNHPFEKEIKSSVQRRLRALGAHAGKAWGRAAVDVKGRIPKTHAGTQRPLTIKGGSAGIPAGGKVKHRADRPMHNRYAKGGKVKKGHTTNIVIAQHPGGNQPQPGPAPMPVPVPMGGGAPPMPPPIARPPIGGPPGLPAGLPPGGLPLRPGMADGGHVSGEYELSPAEHYHNWGEGYKRGGHVKKHHLPEAFIEHEGHKRKRGGHVGKHHAKGGFLGHEPAPGKTYKGYPHSPTTEEDDAVSPTKRGGHIKKHKAGGTVKRADGGRTQQESEAQTPRSPQEDYNKPARKHGGHIKKRAHGGKVEHGDEKEDRKLFGKMIKEHDKAEKRARGGAVHGGKFHGGEKSHNWGRGMAGKGSDVNPGTGGKVDRASVDRPHVSAPGASVHMDEGGGTGLARIAKSKMSQSPKTSKTEM